MVFSAECKRVEFEIAEDTRTVRLSRIDETEDSK